MVPYSVLNHLLLLLMIDSIIEAETVMRNISLQEGAMYKKPLNKKINVENELKMLPFWLEKTLPVLYLQTTDYGAARIKEKGNRQGCKQIAIDEKKKKSQPTYYIHYFGRLLWHYARHCARERYSVLDIFDVYYPPH